VSLLSRTPNGAIRCTNTAPYEKPAPWYPPLLTTSLPLPRSCHHTSNDYLTNGRRAGLSSGFAVKDGRWLLAWAPRSTSVRKLA
jgi:hypothetical protein